MRIKQVVFITIFAIVCGILGMIFYPTTKEKGKEFNSSFDIILYVMKKYELQTPLKLGPVEADKEIVVKGWSPGFGSNHGTIDLPLQVTFTIIDTNNKTVIIKYIDNGPGKKVKLLSTTNVIGM
jgi:hypothetical protein